MQHTRTDVKLCRMDTTDALEAAINAATGRELRINRVRQDNMSQKELARRSGIGVATLQRYESGERAPKLPDLAKLVSALNISLSDFTAAVMDGIEDA